MKQHSNDIKNNILKCNPNFDESSIDMDKMYTVGTEANDYLKAKNLYEREQRKKNSILNKFFN